ncbi:hypothetical protein Tco_0307250 [Tanacetum coccineum]
MISDNEDDIMDPVMQCTTLPSHSSFSQPKLVSFVTEIHTTSLDFLTPNGNPAWANIKQALCRFYALNWKPYQGDSLNLPDHRSYALSWKPCQGDSLNLPDHRLVPSCFAIFDLEPLSFLLTISLDRLDILKEDLLYQSLRKSLSLNLELS